MEELLKEMLEEQKKTNELLTYHELEKNPNELLTAEGIHEEYGIGINTVRKMLSDPDLDAQRYMAPYKVKRQVFDRYLDKKHDYLSERR